MTLASLATCLDMLTRTIDSVGVFDDPSASDEQRVLARLAIRHAEETRDYCEKLKELLDARP